MQQYDSSNKINIEHLECSVTNKEIDIVFDMYSIKYFVKFPLTYVITRGRTKNALFCAIRK